MDVTDALQAGRDAYRRRDWSRARDLFADAHAAGPLQADDVYAWSDAAWWLGESEESLRLGQEAYRLYDGQQRPRDAARVAIEVGVQFFLRGDDALGEGWLRRAHRLLEDQPECPEQGLLLYLTEVEAALGGVAPSAQGSLDRVMASARRVHEIGRRHGVPDLVTCGLLGEGRALVKAGRVPEGLALLDEVLLALVSEEVRPDLAGNVYCHLMSAAHELADLRRLVEWTEATEQWLQTLPVAAVFTGVCRVHRSEVHRVRGGWERAEREAAEASADLTRIDVAAAAEGQYQVGEIRRLRGDLAGAEEAYRQAHRLGRDPQPGVALLRLAQGKIDAASTSIRSALAAAGGDRLACARLYAAQVQIALAAGDFAVAEKACDELEEIAEAYASSGLEAMARHARGAALLAAGHPAEALPVLSDACRRWQHVEAPYECALVRALLAEAYRALGDDETAARELDAAAEAFTALGAAADARRVAALQAGATLPDGLTEREAEVLALVAQGRTNRDIASELVISQRTVDRHLSNIFTKLGLSSRTAAAAYAFAHGLAEPAGGRG